MKDDLDFCIAFIKEVEKNVRLYDYQHPGYSNRRVTETIWSDIGGMFNESGADCKNKWKIIRSSYIRSLNLKSKIGSKAGFKKEYYLGKYLRFLNPFIKNRFHVGNVQSQNTRSDPLQEDINIEFTENPNSQVEIEFLPSPKAIEINQDDEISDAQSAQKLSRNRSKAYKRPLSAVDKCAMMYLNMKRKGYVDNINAERDPCELFLLSLVPHMKSMTMLEQLSFQKGILGLIENIKYRQLQNPENHSNHSSGTRDAGESCNNFCESK
ncbi:uncharacterized protein LOC143913200 [Arctopsyche grandis]|uniref:uncharacterized protein LOC143913200 n=1 Tax=Arctopsyche grandis TaxID=121162 RepID=UPI00406D67C7